MRLVSPLPPGVKLQSRVSARSDPVHLFSTRKTELAKKLKSLRAKLSPEAVIWVSWPKKSSNIPSEVSEDTIREIALPLGLVDVKVCAVTDVWSGLKLVVRKSLR
jgi:hypothetical protein